MDATSVDWSMGSAAARLADWQTAHDLGRRVAGASIPVTPVQRARMREDFAELVPESERLIRAFTGLSMDGFRTRAWVMSRGEWIGANLKALQRLMEPLAERMETLKPGGRAEVRRKALAVQIGGLLGYVSRKVLGQYDVFLPPDDEGLLYFVGPNVAETEQRYALPLRDFRLWIALHEVTHRVQFGATPWLRGYLRELVDMYFGTVQLDSKQLMQQMNAKRDIEAFLQSQAIHRTHCYAHCWFGIPAENAKMWEDYGDKGAGVCLVSSTHRLLRAVIVDSEGNRIALHSSAA